MTHSRYGLIAANVTEETQEFWIKFRQTAKTLGFSYTKALEQAARLWMESHLDRDGVAHRDPLPTPFAGPLAPREDPVDFAPPRKSAFTPGVVPDSVVCQPPVYVPPKENPFK